MAPASQRRQAYIKGGRRVEHRVMVTEEQEKLLQDKANQAGVTIPKLLVDGALGLQLPNTRVLVLELAGVRRKLQEVHNCIAKEAANINTATHAANMGSWSEEEWDELRKTVEWRNEQLTELFAKWAD